MAATSTSSPVDRVLRAGADADHFWVLRRGRVDLTVTAPPGGTVTIATIGPGELLGASWLAAPYRAVFDATATAATDAVEFDAPCLRAKCDRDHELGYVLYRAVAVVMRDRLRSARLQLLDLCEARDG